MKKLIEPKPKNRSEIVAKDVESLPLREPRKPRPFPNLNQAPSDYSSIYTPFEIPEEWNEKEVEIIFNNKITRNKIESTFHDPNNDLIFLPPSFKDVKWVRPDFYIREDLLQKEISFIFPNKKSSKLSRYIRDMYLKDLSVLEKNVSASAEIKSPVLMPIFVEEDNENIIESVNNMKIFREFYKILEKDIEIKVVNMKFIENEDRGDENFQQMKLEQNLKKFEMNLKGEKNKIIHLKTISNNPVLSKLSSVSSEIDEIRKTKNQVACPGDISMKDKYINFSRWLGSIFQTIKDLNILDCWVNKY
jgi:hypothetical protein